MLSRILSVLLTLGVVGASHAQTHTTALISSTANINAPDSALLGKQITRSETV